MKLLNLLKPISGVRIQAIALFVVACVTSPLIFAEQLTAYDIMKQVDERYTGDSSISDATMVLIDKRGNQRIRQMRQFSKEYGEDTKTLTFFLSPADVKDTGFLSYIWDAEDQDDDSWLYLPALRKVKRIAGSDKSGSFMGSDFTYADIEGYELNDYDYKLLKESEIVDGFDTWVIETKPKEAIRDKVIDETGNVKSIAWIRKDILMRIREKIWVKKGKKVKFFSMSDIKEVDGIWTAHKLEMVTKKKGTTLHSTVILTNDLKYNVSMGDETFTSQRLQRGL